jgi:hypothetical protein
VSVDPAIWWQQFPKPAAGTDYTQSFKDVALYTPALSEIFVSNLSEPNANLGGGLSNTDLQFTNPRSKAFFYPWVLYSAGQAATTKAKASEINWLTDRNARDPRVVVIGDSGGYQVQQGTIEFRPETTEQMLRWLERVANYAMILDFPTGGIARGTLNRHIDRLREEAHDIDGEAERHGFGVDFIACLNQTIINNKLFQAKLVPGATTFLNVIQGRNERESSFWYERVKGFPFEGWAFAGKHHTQISMTLRRLLDMQRDGKLASCRWIHFLGVSTLRHGIVLSFLQRALRESGAAPDVQITFDSASPVKSAASGYQATLGFSLGGDGWSFHPQRIATSELQASDDTISVLAGQWQRNRSDRFAVITHVGELVPLRELITARPGKRPTLTTTQLALLIHHNTQSFIEGFRHAYRLLDDRSALDRHPSIRHLDQLLKSVFPPRGTVYPNTLISTDPYAAIAAASSFFDALSLEQA